MKYTRKIHKNWKYVLVFLEVPLLVHFLPGITSDMYFDVLQNPLDPVLTINIENNPSFTDEELIFQRNGAPKITYEMFVTIWRKLYSVTE